MNIDLSMTNLIVYKINLKHLKIYYRTSSWPIVRDDSQKKVKFEFKRTI